MECKKEIHGSWKFSLDQFLWLTVLVLKTISYYFSECGFVLVVVTNGIGEPALSIVTFTLKMKQACPS
jgi:hypothetical protein